MFINKFFADYIGLMRVCGIDIANKWLVKNLLNISSSIRERNLQTADRAMGNGPFEVRKKSGKAKLHGQAVISGIREIWVREVYLNNDYLHIPEKGIVVDLGANMGVFSCFALALSQSGKIIAVEPKKSLNNLFWQQLDLNSWKERAVLNRAFIGGKYKKQEVMIKEKECEGAEFISSGEFLKLNEISHIDFLKCDIEGSEFGLIEEENSLFNITDQVSIEIHDFAGDRSDFIERLKSFGFNIGPIRKSKESCILSARKD